VSYVNFWKRAFRSDELFGRLTAMRAGAAGSRRPGAAFSEPAVLPCCRLGRSAPAGRPAVCRGGP